MDGKPRYDRVRSFLESRGIEIDTGSPDDPPRCETICGLGNRKNEIYQEFIDKGLVKVFPAAVRLIRQLRSKKIKTAVVSSSKNCQKVLAAADIEDLFDVRVDGEVSAELGLAGKPAPDISLKAAENELRKLLTDTQGALVERKNPLRFTTDGWPQARWRWLKTRSTTSCSATADFARATGKRCSNCNPTSIGTRAAPYSG